jgi:hypothetical protein
MNRRQFGQRVACGAGSLLATSALAGTDPAPAKDTAAGKPEQSPHAEALALVFRKAAARIRAVDKGDWWMDTKERAWSVRRPFGPGTIDSTHLFTVTYKIDGKPVAAWWVDTRERKLEETPLEERQPGSRPGGPRKAPERRGAAG